MKSSSVQGLLGLAVAFAAAGAARGGDLHLPCNYFQASGGFYAAQAGPATCYRYAPAPGCTIPPGYPHAARDLWPYHSAAPTTSWYAGDVPGGACNRLFCPACGTVEVRADEPAREPIEPGLELISP